MVNNLTIHKEQWLINFARVGIASKGVVYGILGFLSILVALGYKNSKIEKGTVFKTILEQPFGKILLLVLTAGLSGYVFWCIIKAFRNPYHEPDNAKGKLKRMGYFISGMIYLSFTLLSGSMALNQSSGNGENSDKTMVSKIFDQPFGQWILGLIACGIMIFGVIQIYKGIKEKFMEHIKSGSIEFQKLRIYKYAGKIGFIARGIIFSVIGFLFLKAALHSNPNEAKGTEGAFSFIGAEFGPWLLGFIACGLFAYGVFLFVEAKYAEVHF